MTDIFQNGPRLKGKMEQSPVVNEQDQQEKINPGEENFQSTSDGDENSTNNKPGLIESQRQFEEGNTYEDDPKGDNKVPVN